MTARMLTSKRKSEMGTIIEVAIGIGAILLGMKGFTRDGLPFTNTQRIRGTAGKVVGVLCILLGVACLAFSALPLLTQKD
jgi:hypothetical protein